LNFKLDTKDLIKDIKKEAKKALEKETLILDINCPHCDKLIKQAEVKNKKLFICPSCKKDFMIDYDLNKF
jgi:transposase-like protein